MVRRLPCRSGAAKGSARKSWPIDTDLNVWSRLRTVPLPLIAKVFGRLVGAPAEAPRMFAGAARKHIRKDRPIGYAPAAKGFAFRGRRTHACTPVRARSSA